MYKYSLHKKSIKHNCPNCNKKTLVLYIDTENSAYISEVVGRCDREINCGYHYKPKSYFADNNMEYKNQMFAGLKICEKKQTSYHNEKEILETLSFYSENNFVTFLKSKFDIQEVEKIIADYKIGTAQFWNFGTVFWQVDINNLIRGGKIIIYNKSGKRTKYINWFHSIKKKLNQIAIFNLNQCFFGEHLLNNCNKDIAIVESEKTACIMSSLFQKYLWIAAGSLNGLNDQKMQVLKNRKIILYPDLGIHGPNGSPFDIWNRKCQNYTSLGYDIQISNLLEVKCSTEDRIKGFDIADFFIQSQTYTPPKLISNEQKKVDLLYTQNKNLKLLIELFDLTDSNGSAISVSPIG